MMHSIGKTHKIFVFCLTLVALSAFSCLFAATPEPPSHIKWQNWSNTIFEQAQKSNHQILLFAKASWCQWCQKMENVTFKNEQVIKYINANFVPVTIDIEKESNISAQYHIIDIPTIVIINTNNQVIKTISGYNTPEELLTNIKEISVESSKKTPLESEKRIQITIVGNKNDPVTLKFYKEISSHPNMLAEIEIINPGEQSKKHPEITFPILDKPAAFICTPNHCSLPVYNAQELSRALDQLRIYESKSSSNKIIPFFQGGDTSGNLLSESNSFISLFSFWVLGLLLAFTPCILPLLLIIVAYLGGQSAEIPKSRIFFLTLTYIIALALTYAIAGLIASFFGLYIQAYFQNKGVVISFSILFFCLGLSMLDFYKLELPTFLRRKVIKQNKLQSRYSYFQVATMGILATLIAAPCAVAPLIGVLSYISTTGNLTFGTIALFFFGLGIGTPLIIATTIGVSILPKSHDLQEGVKLLFGIVLIAIAIWLLRNIIPGWWSMILWSALIIYTSLLMTHFTKFHRTNKWRLWQALSIMLLTYGIALFIGAMLGNIDPLEPLNLKHLLARNDTKEAAFKMITSMKEFNEVVVEAKKIHKPILLNFTAEWCQACQKLDKLFSAPQTQPVLRQYILLRVDLTDKANFDLAKQFNVLAPPATLIFNDDGSILNVRLYDDVDEKKLRTIIQEIPKGKSK